MKKHFKLIIKLTLIMVEYLVKKPGEIAGIAPRNDGMIN